MITDAWWIRIRSFLDACSGVYVGNEARYHTQLRAAGWRTRMPLASVAGGIREEGKGKAIGRIGSRKAYLCGSRARGDYRPVFGHSPVLGCTSALRPATLRQAGANAHRVIRAIYGGRTLGLGAARLDATNASDDSPRAIMSCANPRRGSARVGRTFVALRQKRTGTEWARRA